MTFTRILLEGNIGKDPEFRLTKDGEELLTFPLAVSRSRKVGNEWKQETTWFQIAYKNANANALSTRLRKGQQVFIKSQELKVVPWKGRDGAKAEIHVLAVFIDPLDEVRAAGGSYPRPEDVWE